MNVKILNFIMKSDICSRKEGSKLIREHFGEEGYKYYQDLWSRRCLRINEWACLVLTRKGHLEEREIKGWDRTSNNSRKDDEK